MYSPRFDGPSTLAHELTGKEITTGISNHMFTKNNIRYDLLDSWMKNMPRSLNLDDKPAKLSIFRCGT